MSDEDLFHGCPYSLPDEVVATAQLQSLREIEQGVRDRVNNAAAILSGNGLIGQVYSDQNAREIYESNALEGLGPSLTRTAEILTSPAAGKVKTAVDTLKDEMFIRSVQEDRHIVEVLGLLGAKILAEDLLRDLNAGVALTEVDLRSMHSLIAVDETYAGRYKWYHVKIGGEDSHEPVWPIDTPDAMRALVDWLAKSGGLPATLRAAIAHAWLTHIHPFEDGNGRLARILANIVLAQAGLPPAIIKHKSQRDAYLDALAHSDIAGDIMPLAGIFVKAVKQFAREIEKPAFLRKILRDEIARSTSSVFSGWQVNFNNLMARIFGELRLSNVRISDLGRLDGESFAFLSETDTSGSTWLFKLWREELELLVWMGYSSDEMNSFASSLVRYPSMFFSVPNPPYSLKPYRPAHSAEVGGLQEVCLTHGITPKIYMRKNGEVVQLSDINSAARRISGHIVAGFDLRRSRA